MKTLLCFVVLFGLEGSRGTEQYWLGHVNGYNVYPVHSHQDHLNLHHQENSNHNDIQRPCHIHDLNCIRQFFAHNSKCSPAYGPAPDPYIIKKGPIDTPHGNVTITLNNAQLIGLNTGKIKEFYINKKSGVLVLEVVFGKIIVDSPRTVVAHHRKGKEPVEEADFTKIEFIDMSLTLTVQPFYEINLAKSHVYTYLTNQPYMIYGAGLTTKGALYSKKWIYELSLSVQEGMVSQGPLYISVFLQSKICDFGHRVMNN